MVVQRAVKAALADDWSALMRSDELNPCYNQARQQHDQRTCIVQIRARETWHCRTCAHTARRFQLEDCSWWVSLGHGDSAKSRKKQCHWWCAACGQYNWKDPNRVSVMQDGAEPTTVKVFRAHAEPQGACENLSCAFSLLAN